MIEIVQEYRTNGDSDIPCWVFEVTEQTNDYFCIWEQILAQMMRWTE